MSVAIVLSGGTTRGDFEVGVVHALYDRGVVPDILCGTSVGSVNAVKLAEGEGLPTQGLKGLINIWQNVIRTPTDVFSNEPWISSLDPRLQPLINSILGGSGNIPQLGSPGLPFQIQNSAWGDLGVVLNGFASLIGDVTAEAWLNDMGVAILKAFELVLSAKGIINLNPVRAQLNTHIDPTLVTKWAAAAPGRALRIAMVGLDSGRLRYMTETGALVEEDMVTPVMGLPAPPNCSALAQQLQSLIDQRNTDIRNDVQDGVKPGQDPEVKQLAAQIATITQQLAACRAQQPAPPAPVKVSLVDGVIASSSQPGIMPAANLFNEAYVDGGVRQTLPLEAAIKLNATTIWAIQSSPQSGPSGPYVGASALSCAARAVQELAFDQLDKDDELNAVNHDVRFIRPVVAAHSPYTLDPGTVQISLDYGYMRGADVFDKRDGFTQQLADQITTLRTQTWQLEEGAAASDVPVIRANKRELHRLVSARRVRGGAIPAGLESQWLTWEKHVAAPIAATPWVDIVGPQHLPLANPFDVFNSVVAATAWGLNRLDIFAVGAQGQMLHKAWDGNWHPSPTDWESLGGVFTSSPAVISRGANRLDIFGVGTDGQMFHKSWDGAWHPSPTDWEALGGNFSSPPVAVAMNANRLDVFAVGNDGQMYHKSWDGSWHPSQSQWEGLGGLFTGMPAAVISAPGHIDVFGIGTDGQMFHKTWDVTWHPSQTDWELLGGTFTSSPAVASWGPNRLDIFALGIGGGMFHKSFDIGWHPSQAGWEPLGGVFTSMPSVTSWGPNRLDVFGLGIGGDMFHRSWNGIWQPADWEPLNESFLSPPTSVSWGANRIDLFGIGTGGQMLHKAWNGSWLPAGSNWESMGGTFKANL